MKQIFFKNWDKNSKRYKLIIMPVLIGLSINILGCAISQDKNNNKQRTKKPRHPRADLICDAKKRISSLQNNHKLDCWMLVVFRKTDAFVIKYFRYWRIPSLKIDSARVSAITIRCCEELLCQNDSSSIITSKYILIHNDGFRWSVES